MRRSGRRALLTAAAALALAVPGCGPLMFVGNEVALHRVAGEVIRRILAGEPLDTRSVAMAAAAADLSPQGIRN